MLPHGWRLASRQPRLPGWLWRYIYTYDCPRQRAYIKTYTIEGGDNQQAEEMEYSFVNTFTLEGNRRGWMISSEWFGRQVTNALLQSA